MNFNINIMTYPVTALILLYIICLFRGSNASILNIRLISSRVRLSLMSFLLTTKTIGMRSNIPSSTSSSS